MIAITELSTQHVTISSLADWEREGLLGTEWVNDQLLEKNGMTLPHGRVQLRLGRHWANYAESSGLGGEVYTDVPCRTQKQGRSPDVAYLTPELVTQYGEVKTLPQSFLLIAEIISPTDHTEDVFNQANEYLVSGCEEVWLVLPESLWIVVITRSQRCLFTTGETISTQQVLPGFSIDVDRLLK